MPIEAKQSKNENWDFEVVSERLNRADGSPAPMFANVRTDTNEILGYGTERYGIVQNSDLIATAEQAFASRGIEWSKRDVYTTDNGAKLRAVYDLSGDMFKSDVPQVGDIMGYRLTVQNSFDRSLRVSFAMGLLRLVCENGMQTMEKDIDMVSKHSTKLDLSSLITPAALDKALTSLKGSTAVYGKLANVKLEEEQGLNILTNLTDKKIISDKLRERVAQIWNSRSDMLDSNNHDPNLYNLYNAVTQHLTRDVEDTRFEYANRIGNNVLKQFSLAADNKNRLTKLFASKVNPEGVVSNN